VLPSVVISSNTLLRDNYNDSKTFKLKMHHTTSLFQYYFEQHVLRNTAEDQKTKYVSIFNYLIESILHIICILSHSSRTGENYLTERRSFRPSIFKIIL